VAWVGLPGPRVVQTSATGPRVAWAKASVSHVVRSTGTEATCGADGDIGATQGVCGAIDVAHGVRIVSGVPATKEG
jgi:hypothetical protein